MHPVVRQYRRKGILIDTNLLLGFLIGTLGKRHLVNCRATKNFSGDDFDLLESFLRQFERVVTTPHILTEVSNLAGRLPESIHPQFRANLKGFIGKAMEKLETAKTISDGDLFERFGLTDAGISLIAPGQHLLLTDDLALYGALIRKGIDAVNFNHVRYERWQ